MPSSANLSYYLDIVKEKYLLRKLIATCTSVVGKVYDFEGEVDELLDEVEKEILHVNESREQNEVKDVKKLVNEALVTIEHFFNRKGELSGLATGFPDLDKMTDGLHGGEMIIIAARPSMGKCLAFDSEIVLSDGSMATIQEVFQNRNGKLFTLTDGMKLAFTRPSDFVDDGLKPVFRVTTRVSHCRWRPLCRIRFLTVRSWSELAELKVGDHIRCATKIGWIWTRDRSRMRSQTARLPHW